MTRIYRSLLLSALERYGTFFLFVLSTGVLSRLLTAEDFGVYAILTSLMAVTSAAFQEFGGANYIIQRKHLTLTDIRTAFTATFCFSSGIAVVLFAIRAPLSHFFGAPGLILAIEIYVLNILLSPITNTISALLRRELQFGRITLVNFSANVILSAVSIVLAFSGFGFMAPVWGSVCGTFASVVLMLVARPDFRIFRPHLKQTGDVFRFGAYSSAVALINVFYQAAPQMIIARIINIAAVGLYSRAVNATQIVDRLVIQAINPVIMPAIFEKIKAGACLKHIYLRSLAILTVLQWPFLIYLALMAEPIVVIWLGARWVEVVPLTRLLCIASLPLAAACLTYPVLVAVGRVRDTLTMSLVSVPLSLVITFAASFFGIKVVAASAVIALPLQALVAFRFICRGLGISAAQLTWSMYKSAVVAVCTAGGILAGPQFSNTSAAVRVEMLAVCTLGALTGWCFGVILMRHPVLAEIRLIVRGVGQLQRNMLGRGRDTLPACE